MPNIQFNAVDDLYFWHKKLSPEEKRDVNDVLRNTPKRQKERRGKKPSK